MNEPHGFRVWFAVAGGIGAWLTHLIAESALARRTCLTHDEWVLHLLTVALAGITVVAMLMAARLRQPVTDGGTLEQTELTFLGKMGLLIGGINVLLIVFEG